MDFSGGVDLTKVISVLLSSVPVWMIAYLIFKSWEKRSEKAQENLDLKFKSIDKSVDAIRISIQETLSSMNAKLNRIELTLEAQGVETLRQTISDIQKQQIILEQKLQAAWDRIEMLQN